MSKTQDCWLENDAADGRKLEWLSLKSSSRLRLHLVFNISQSCYRTTFNCWLVNRPWHWLLTAAHSESLSLHPTSLQYVIRCLITTTNDTPSDWLSFIELYQSISPQWMVNKQLYFRCYDTMLNNCCVFVKGNVPSSGYWFVLSSARAACHSSW